MSKDLCRLLSDNFEITKSESDNDLRQFSGVANSGKPFNYCGMPTVVDFAELSHKDKVPFLYVHDRKCETGHGQLTIENNELAVTGKLLTSEWGEKVANGYDEGFPWQLSVDVRASKLDELAHGESAVVNSNEVVGPLAIMRKCSIVEVSFTPTGVDEQTHATVLSDDGNPNQSTKTDKDTTMTLEEALAKIETLEADKVAQQKRIDELEATAKESKVEAELSQAGFSKDKDGKWQGVSDSTVNLLLSATDDDRTATIADLAKGNTKPTAEAIPGALLSEQHKGESKQGVQLSDNPLIANAMARGESGGRF